MFSSAKVFGSTRSHWKLAPELMPSGSCTVFRFAVSSQPIQ